MAYTPITAFTIVWDHQHKKGEVRLNLDTDSQPEVQIPMPSLADAGDWAALLGAGATCEWDTQAQLLRIAR